MRRLYSKNRIMPDFPCPVSTGAQDNNGHFRNHFVIAVVASAPYVFPAALEPISSAGRPIARRLKSITRADLSRRREELAP